MQYYNLSELRVMEWKLQVELINIKPYGQNLQF